MSHLVAALVLSLVQSQPTSCNNVFQLLSNGDVVTMNVVCLLMKVTVNAKLKPAYSWLKLNFGTVSLHALQMSRPYQALLFCQLSLKHGQAVDTKFLKQCIALLSDPHLLMQNAFNNHETLEDLCATLYK